MTVPDVSVVLVSYNTRELTLRCLSALHAGSGRDVEFDVIVVDNASRDGSADAIAAEYPTVRLLRLDENVGWGQGINRAAAVSRADYLLLLNPDTVPRGALVDELVGFARTHPGHGIYTGRTLHPSGEDDGYSCQRLPTLWSVVTFATGLSTVFRRQDWANPDILPRYDRRSVREVPAVSGCLMMVERDLFTRLRGFDPTYFMYSEDIDFSARARTVGARPILDPDASVIHIGGASSTSAGQRVGLLRGKATYLRRHWSPGRAWLGTHLLVLGVGLRAGGSVMMRRRGEWVEVFRQRAQWRAGWPPVDEPGLTVLA
jgi:N-acetylglucosaminyl-diphospho-decaprenol L-rhamnosyltransferase